MKADALCALEEALEAISEKYWCAGWRYGIEFLIWDRLHGLELVRGNLPLTDDEITRLRSLSAALGGWVVNPLNDALRVISVDGWLELHRRYRAGEDVHSILESLPKSS